MLSDKQIQKVKAVLANRASDSKIYADYDYSGDRQIAVVVHKRRFQSSQHRIFSMQVDSDAKQAKFDAKVDAIDAMIKQAG